MRDPKTDSAARARSILAAWERRDLQDLETELRLPGHHCASPRCHTPEEQERLDLLDGIAKQMRQDLPHLARVGDPQERAGVCVRLLEHLSQQSAIRSGKLSFFPY